MNITVFCGSSMPMKDSYAEAATLLGKTIAEKGHTLLYGGSNLGVMGLVSGAALSAGGRVTGVIPSFFSEEIINSQPVTELVRVKSMAERKEYLIAVSHAFIALPGGIGTLDEILEVMVANQLGLMKDSNGNTITEGKPIALLNPDGFYDPFFSQIKTMGENGFFRSGKHPYVFNCKSIEELTSALLF